MEPALVELNDLPDLPPASPLPSPASYPPLPTPRPLSTWIIFLCVYIGMSVRPLFAFSRLLSSSLSFERRLSCLWTCVSTRLSRVYTVRTKKSYHCVAFIHLRSIPFQSYKMYVDSNFPNLIFIPYSLIQYSQSRIKRGKMHKPIKDESKHIIKDL